MKEVLFKEAHEQVGAEVCANGSSLDIEVMLEVEGEVVVGDELGELDNK